MDNQLSIIPLSGVTGVTKNMYLYEYKDQILVVDCGLGFPDETMLGVDLMIPDITYLKTTNKKIVGMALTHGHEDHIGALPYVVTELPDFNIYATPFTAALTNEKLKEFGLGKRVISNPFEKSIQIGAFNLTFIRVTHSVPDTSHIFIKTPAGNFYHGSDFKIDDSPYDGKVSDLEKIRSMSSSGVVCTLSDALGAEKPGRSRPETSLTSSIEEAVRNTRGKFILTTYSSNISRLNQVIEAAEKNGRLISFLGRSLIKAKDVATKNGYMKLDPKMEVDIKQLRNIKDSNVVLVVAGAQGQEGSALSRIVEGDNKDVVIKPQDTVVFSSDTIPGNELSVYGIVDAISKIGATVLYSGVSSDFHVSGHGPQDDLAMLMDLTKPKNVFPIGGTYRHIAAYKKLALSRGFSPKNVVLPDDGLEIVFQNGEFKYGRKIPTKNIYVDQLSGEEIETFVLRDREKLSKEGLVIVIAEVESNGRIFGNPNIIAKGFSVNDINKINRGLSSEIKNKFKTRKNKVSDWNYERKTIGSISENYIFRALKRRPLVLPVVIEV